MTKKYILGSGKLYTYPATFDASGDCTIPSDATLETTANRIGCISGGATLEYTPTFYDVKDDLGEIDDSHLTEESAILKSGVLTFDGNVLAKLASTADVDETVSGKRTVTIGGLSNYSADKYIIRFVGENSNGDTFRVTIVGKNTSGFELAFQKDNETVINAEFKASPINSNGRLIIFTEDDDDVE